MAKESQNENNLMNQIMKRNSERAASANSFFDHLMSKYGGGDDSEEYEMPKMKSMGKTKKNTTKRAKETNGKSADRKVKKGKVAKRK